MADGEVNLTYETLFDITRREKLQSDLQKLDPDFFKNLVVYINDKSKLLSKDTISNNVFARTERQITEKQIENIRKLVSELYMRRERKIVNLAIIKSRTNSRLIDTSSLLPQEKSLFNFFLQLLNHSKRNILYNLLRAESPSSLDLAVCFQLGQQAGLKTASPVVNSNQPTFETKIQSSNISSTSSQSISNSKPIKPIVEKSVNVTEAVTIKKEPAQLKKSTSAFMDDSNNVNSSEDTDLTIEKAPKSFDSEASISDSNSENDTSNKMIKFLSSVPKFVGKELETYGPYDKDDVATLPPEVAEILIKKGRAQQVES